MTDYDESPAARGRAFVAGFLVVLGCLLAFAATPVAWADRQLTTERYVETVTPLVSEPAVQEAVANQVGARISGQLDLADQLDRTLDRLAAAGVPEEELDSYRTLTGSLDVAVTDLVRTQIRALLGTRTAEEQWISANRAAFDSLVAALRTDSGEARQVTVDVGPILADLRDELVANGFEPAREIRPVEAEFVLLGRSGVVEAQRWYRIVDTLSVVLPVAALVMFVAAVAVSPRRLRTAYGVAVGVAVTMAVLLVGVRLGRDPAADQLDAAGMGTVEGSGSAERAAGDDVRAAAEAVYDAFAGSFSADVRWVLGAAAVLAVVLALVSWVARRRDIT